MTSSRFPALQRLIAANYVCEVDCESESELTFVGLIFVRVKLEQAFSSSPASRVQR